MSTAAHDFTDGADAAAFLLEPPLSPVLAAPTRAVDRPVETASASSREERRRLQDAVADAERAIDENRHADAIAGLAGHTHSLAHPDLAFAALLAQSWATMVLGDIPAAIELLDRARSLSERPMFGDADRAEALYRLGCCRFKLSQISTAASLFTVALQLAERSGAPCDRLRANIFEWRSRVYQRQRDWEAAQADVERALELAGSLGDQATLAHVQFQASIVAERTGQTLLARFYAEEARDGYAAVGDQLMLGRITNNLGAIHFLLGKNDEAVAHLEQAFALAVEADSQADAAQAVSSLAQVHLRTGRPAIAEEKARKALEMLGGRVDFLDEIGNVQLVLGRALLEQDRHDEAEDCFRAADRSFEELGSASHRAAAWVALGDLSASRRDTESAAALYRTAAEALQDFHF